MANQFLALSMFIMLLSFFIILNALSNFEEAKSRPVLNSLTLAFSNEDTPEDIEAEIVEDEAKALRQGDALDQIQALFSARIAGIEARKNRLGTLMHIRMPRERFEREVMKEPEGAQEAFGGSLADTLATLMFPAEEDVIYRMDIILNVSDTPASVQNDNPAKANSLINQVSLYTTRMENAGLPPKLVTAGLGRGPENTIDLYFKRYYPINPLEGEVL